MHGLEELELERVLEIGAATEPLPAPTTPTAAPTEAEEIPEQIGEVAEDLVGILEAGIHARTPEPRVTEPIVGRALVRVREHAVGLRRFLEPRLRLRVARIAIRVML